MTRKVRIDIGAESDSLGCQPRSTSAGPTTSWVNTRDGYKLLSVVCPHQGGTIGDEGDAFVCDTHAYEYEQDGSCHHQPRTAHEVLRGQRRGRRMIALAPDETEASSPQAGLTVQQIADDQGKHVIDALLDMVVEDDMATEFYADTQGRDQAHYTAEVLDSNHIVAGVSDGGAHVKFLTAGIYPTDMLTWLVRDEKVITLEDAHYKLSSCPPTSAASRTAAPCAKAPPADVVIYDLQRLEVLPSEVAEDLPRRRVAPHPEGQGLPLHHGQRRGHLRDGEPTGAYPGRLLRNGRG